MSRTKSLALIQKLLRMGRITPNEARILSGMRPLPEPEMDVAYIKKE